MFATVDASAASRSHEIAFLYGGTGSAWASPTCLGNIERLGTCIRMGPSTRC